MCCIYFGATVCELRTRKNSRVLDIVDCVSFARVDYLSLLSLSWCVASGLYCVLESYLHCGVVVV